MMTPTNPWAWKSLPSTYDNVNDIIKRDIIISKRRIQALISSITILKGETVEEQPSELLKQRQNHVNIINNILQSKNDDDIMMMMKPWLLTPKKDSNNLKLNLSLVSPIIIKECLKSFGLDGLPNIPLVRRFNAGELSKHIKKIKKEDEFLYMKGINSLENDELELACRDRCINVNRNTNVLRKDLSDYITRSCKKDTTTTINNIKGKPQQSLVMNENNRIMALLAINVLKDFKQSSSSSSSSSSFSSTYKLLNI